MAVIRKAQRVLGKTLAFRDAAPADAAFVLRLRMEEDKVRFLSATPPSLARQTAWLQDYARRQGEAYFIMEAAATGQAAGAVRLYDAEGDSFSWGSWAIINGAPAHYAIESALMVYAYALDWLGFTAAHFKVRKDNGQVLRFHERFGATRTGELDGEWTFSIAEDAIRHSLARYKKYLPGPVQVRWPDALDTPAS